MLRRLALLLALLLLPLGCAPSALARAVTAANLEAAGVSRDVGMLEAGYKTRQAEALARCDPHERGCLAAVLGPLRAAHEAQAAELNQIGAFSRRVSAVVGTAVLCEKLGQPCVDENIATAMRWYASLHFDRVRYEEKYGLP